MNKNEETQQVSTLITAWFEGDYPMFDAVTDEPEMAWQAIVEISNRDLTEEQQSLLAGSPLETLLAWHAPAFVDRIEKQAKTNSRFRHLLGGVWRRDVPNQIWERIECVRGAKW